MARLLLSMTFVIFVLGGCGVNDLRQVHEETSDVSLFCLNRIYPQPNVSHGASPAEREFKAMEDWSNKEFVIGDNESYQFLFKYKSTTGLCNNLSLPSIDFSNHTLLGKNVFLSDCYSTELRKEVIRDDVGRTYTYRLRAKRVSSVCMGPGDVAQNWVTIPKARPGYQISFEVTD